MNKRDAFEIRSLTDEDGWYVIFYKHTGKPTTFTVTLSEVPGRLGKINPKTVTLRANVFAQVDFEVE